MRILHLTLAALLSLGALQAQAQRLPVPIVNHENVVVAAASGKQLTAADVRKAILVAAEATGRKWSVAEAGPGRLIATYHVRTHTVSAEIQYTDSRFSVVYSSSTNMKYAPGPDGKGVIHPFYNQWVQEFVQAIRSELART